MKNKSLFVTIVIALSFLIGAKDMLISLLGDHTGVITVAFITLFYQLLVLIMKTVYNTGNWMKGWSTAFIILNMAMLVPQVFGVVNAWAADSNVILSSGFLMVMSKLTVFSNLVIFLLNADWTALSNSFLEKKVNQ